MTHMDTAYPVEGGGMDDGASDKSDRAASLTASVAGASSQGGIPSALDDLESAFAERSEAVRTAILRLGQLPLPVEAQYRLGELYADLGATVVVFAQAIEARRAETGTGSVRESAVAESDAP